MGAHKGKTNSMEDVMELLRKDGYSEAVIDHWLNPRNLGQTKNYDGYSKKITSSCGDSMWVWLKVKDDVIQNAAYLRDICTGAFSSGSMLPEMVKGKRITEASRISPGDILRPLGGLPENFVHYATLAEMALKAAPWKILYQQKS